MVIQFQLLTCSNSDQKHDERKPAEIAGHAPCGLAGFPSRYAAGDDFRILIVEELAGIAIIAGAVIAFRDLLDYAPLQLPQ